MAVKDLVAFLVAHDMPVPAGLRDRKRVLVVDDDPAMAHAIQRVLNGSGFETRTAGDGFRAGALLATFGPAVMTLDLRMPGIGGMEVLEFLRKSPELADIKVLVISALPREHLQDALAAGAHDALEKPFDNGVLVDTVSRLAREPD